MPNLHLEKETQLLKKHLFDELELLFTESSKWESSDFDLLFKSYMNALLKTEFELFIKNSGQDTIRNGYVTKTVKSLHGEIEIKVPRERSGNFESKVLTKYSSYTEELAKAIIKLYQLGLSNADVASYINEIYGVTYSRQSISSITKVTSELVQQFKSRTLDKRYIALFLDATYIPVKFENTFEKTAVHLIVGINCDGYQEIIGYVTGFKESNILWADALDDIKSRGVSEVDIFVSDGFVGIDSIIKQRYPKSRIQRCTVHLVRNLMTKVTNKDTPAILAEFKELFKMSSRDSFNMQLEHLKQKYPKYEATINRIFSGEYVTTYLDFPLLMHRTIKTTNRIEAVNQKIKTRIRFKQNFPNIESLERMLVSSIIAQNGKSNRIVGGMEDYNKTKRM